MNENTASAESGSSLRKLASGASLIVASLLVAVKLTAWAITGSIALLTSAVDAIVDVASSIATYLGVRFAERPADTEHRFGHGKGEAVAGFTQATFLAGSALVLAFQSGQRILFPEPLHNLDLGIWVILLSLLAAAGLVLMQTSVAKRTGSIAIASDRAHYLADVTVNPGVLGALGITRLTGRERADPTIAGVISIYMLWNAYGIANDTLAQLLDRELPEEERRRIEHTALACRGAVAIHDLRTRSAGDRVFVEYHLEVDGRLTVAEGHDIGDATEAAVASILPGTAEVMAHIEPAGIQDERLDTVVHGVSSS